MNWKQKLARGHMSEENVTEEPEMTWEQVQQETQQLYIKIGYAEFHTRLIGDDIEKMFERLEVLAKIAAEIKANTDATVKTDVAKEGTTAEP